MTAVSHEMYASVTGTLILVVGAAGSGKGEIIAHLRAMFPEIACALSATTRHKRPGEIEGTTYQFVSPEEFERKIRNGEFLEWVEKDGGNKYGTIKSTIVDPLQKGHVVLREVDVPGVRSILEIFPRKNVCIVWIDAGSWDILSARIKKRAPITEEELEFRRKRYMEEIPFFTEHADVHIYNSDGELEHAKKEVEKIVRNLLSR